MGTAGADNVTGAGELHLPKPPDVVRPASKALAVTGRAGKTVRLLFMAGDDEGTVAVVEQVKRNGRVVATLRKDGIHATTPRQLWVPWQAPAKPKGAFQHCIVATDTAGNKSPESCAKVTLRQA